MDWVKNKGLRYTFWSNLGLRRFLPCGISKYSHRPECRGTVIFANHCQIFGRGPLRDKNHHVAGPGFLLTDVKMISPIRPGTHSALVVGNYGGDLLMDLHYDPRYLSEPEAAEFLEIFAEQIGAYPDKA